MGFGLFFLCLRASECTIFERASEHLAVATCVCEWRPGRKALRASAVLVEKSGQRPAVEKKKNTGWDGGGSQSKGKVGDTFKCMRRNHEERRRRERQGEQKRGERWGADLALL